MNLSVEDVARQLGAKRSGVGWTAKCPAHDDRVASLSISEGEAGRVLLHCHAGCETELVLTRLGVEMKELAGDSERPPSDETVYRYRDEKGVALYEVVKHVAPNGEKKFAQRRANGEWGLGEVRRVLYRLPELLASGDAPVLIPEGEKDVETLRARKFIATTNLGGAGKGKWRPEFSEPLRNRDVILLPDNDDVGRDHMQRIAAALSSVAKSVRIVEIPNLPPKGDVTDFFARGAKIDDFKAIVWPQKKSMLLAWPDVSDKIEALWMKGVQRGVDTGWPSLDKHFTVRKKELTIITGVPGQGKTVFIDALVINLARIHGWRTGIFSAENLPIERHASGLLEKFIGEPFGKPGDSFRMSPDNLARGVAFLTSHIQFIEPRDDGQSLATILEAMHELVDRGVDAIVLDPWNEIDHAIPNGQTETDYVDASLRKLRRFARFNDIHLFIVVHPAKMRRDQNGNYPVPTLYDISGSAHFRNKADNGIVVWRDVTDDTNNTFIHVQKIRFREVGSIGTVRLWYQTSTGRFIDRDGGGDA